MRSLFGEALCTQFIILQPHRDDSLNWGCTRLIILQPRCDVALNSHYTPLIVVQPHKDEGGVAGAFMLLVELLHLSATVIIVLAALWR
jgi:hypothetical protein